MLAISWGSILVVVVANEGALVDCLLDFGAGRFGPTPGRPLLSSRLILIN